MSDYENSVIKVHRVTNSFTTLELIIWQATCAKLHQMVIESHKKIKPFQNTRQQLFLFRDENQN